MSGIRYCVYIRIQIKRFEDRREQTGKQCRNASYPIKCGLFQ